MLSALVGVALMAAPAAATRLSFIEDDYPAALALAQKRKVPLFIDAWAPWCHSCVFMKEHVLNRPELGKHGPRCVFLSIDTEKEKNAAFLQKYPIDSWPTLFIIDSEKETVALRWPGSVDVDQFGKLLDDGEKALRAQPRGSAEAKLAQADRLFGQRKLPEAVAAYREALAAMKPEHPRRARAVESLITALSASVPKDCAQTALAEAPTLPRGPSFLNVVYLGLDCRSEADPQEAWRAPVGEKLFALAQEALKLDGVLADDRSGLYETLIEYLTEKAEKKEATALAKAWLEFLEGEAAKAPTPAARAVFDPHRVNAALASGQPQRVVEPLLKSEQELGSDYNPAARLALVYRELGKLDEALAAADRAMAKVYGPRKLRVLEIKASIFARKGDLAAQKKVLTEAVATAKALPEGQRSEPTIARLSAELNKVPAP
jgi:thioredoxin-like negative regulator of GroEL